MVAGQKAAQFMNLRHLAQGCAASLAQINAQAPRVHCLTNPVAMTLSANLLLAVGARPSMTQAADQLDEFIAASAALCVNLGMLDAARREAITAGLESAARHQVPWVLDPVKVHLSATRCAYARQLFSQRPAAIRGNQRELAALATGADLAGLARATACVIAATGCEDQISDGHRHHTLIGGSPLMARTIASGCALSALLAAFVAVNADPFTASVQALFAYKIAGTRAARRASGPGSFPAVLLDELAGLNEALLLEETACNESR